MAVREQVSQLAADTAPAPNASTWKAVTQPGHEAPRWCASKHCIYDAVP